MESSKPCKLGFCGSRLRFEMASCDWPMLGRVCVNSLRFQIWGNWADGYPENEGYRLREIPKRTSEDAFLIMSGKRGSNSRPSAWEADALPTELLPLLRNKVIIFF